MSFQSGAVHTSNWFTFIYGHQHLIIYLSTLMRLEFISLVFKEVYFFLDKAFLNTCESFSN